MKILVKKLKGMLAAIMLVSATPHITANATQAGDDELAKNLPVIINTALKKLDLYNGVSIAVVKDSEIVYSAGFGFADYKAKKPVTTDTSFYIASTTKSFTGLAALTLAEKGLIDLDRSLADYFPEVSFDQALKADQITIRHLLSHTHGLDNDPIGYSAAYTGNHTPAKMLELLRHTSINEDAPFGHYQYTNLGYNIFSMILERELNKPWQDILAEEIFTPLGLQRTSAYISDAKKYDWPLAKPYMFAGADRDEPLYLVKKDNTMHAAGGMIASADDIAKFLIAQINEGVFEGKQVFPKSTVQEAHKILTEVSRKRAPYNEMGYSMGWSTSTFFDQKLLHHFGGFAGASSHMSFMPDHDIGLVILMNETAVANRMGSILARYVYDEMMGVENTIDDRLADIDQLANMIVNVRARIAADTQARAERVWQMSLPLVDYAGSYSNPLYGDLTITFEKPTKLVVHFGNMHALATPYKGMDSLRLELVPGRGMPISFEVVGERVSSVQYNGTVFSKN